MKVLKFGKPILDVYCRKCDEFMYTLPKRTLVPEKDTICTKCRKEKK